MTVVVIDTYMIRYPMGGMLSWAVQYALGVKQLGHEVYLVEKGWYPDACWDPVTGRMTDDPTNGWKLVTGLLDRFALADRVAFVDRHGESWGYPKERINDIVAGSDVFIDMDVDGDWLEEARDVPHRIVVDGEPGFTQIHLQHRLDAGKPLITRDFWDPTATSDQELEAPGKDNSPQYTAWYTNGLNIGTPRSPAPTAGIPWRHIPNPVATDLYKVAPPPPAEARFTTVMNWQSHAPVVHNGITFGQKDVEFAKFMDLPGRTPQAMEVAVAGSNVPHRLLSERGWKIRQAHDVTASFDAYMDYIRASRGEFSVCKNVFFATNSGWTSDRTAAYLASGRPAVVEDTGFGAIIPTGDGLFAVRTVEEAVAAIEEINAGYERHARAARELACEYFDARKVMGRLLDEVTSGSQPQGATSLDQGSRLSDFRTSSQKAPLR